MPKTSPLTPCFILICAWGLLFATAAQFWEDRDVPANLSQTGLFETFWAFAGQQLEGYKREQFREALCYDFCLVDYPSNGTLPVFFSDDPEMKNRDKGDINDRIRQLGIASGSRVRSYVRQFPRDYRSTPSPPRPTRLLFVYISAPGRGMQVRILDLNH